MRAPRSRRCRPLIKGYLRLGAYIGDGAVIDHQFGTTDVLIIVPVEAMKERYFVHFGAPDEFSAPILRRIRAAELKPQSGFWFDASAARS